MRLVAAEFRKLTYQRAMWGLLIAGVLFAMLGTIATPFIIDQSADGLGFGTLAVVVLLEETLFDVTEVIVLQACELDKLLCPDRFHTS